MKLPIDAVPVVQGEPNTEMFTAPMDVASPPCPITSRGIARFAVAAGQSSNRQTFAAPGSPIVPPPAEKPDVFEYDPKTPLPSIGGDLFIEPRGVRDHRPADEKSLTFTTAPFAEDTEISGPLTLELYIASTADDTDFVATVTDVRPDGYSAYLRQNVQRASSRESLENPTPIIPGKIYKLTIAVFPLSNVFFKGHRLRLTVSSSSLPRYLPGHNKFLKNNQEDEAPWIVAHNTVYHDAQRPSVLIVPVVPNK